MRNSHAFAGFETADPTETYWAFPMKKGLWQLWPSISILLQDNL